MRILITGDVKTGKSTLARSLNLPIKHTDELPGTWLERLYKAQGWFNQEDPCVMAGVLLPSALRKWLETHPTGKPADKVIYLEKNLALQHPKHRPMSKGMRGIWAKMEATLKQRGVVIERHYINTTEDHTPPWEK